ncbi:tyrosine-type recombinase/integrase [Paenibacillus sp. LHD-38]|uniref:tyrosine-type recombinase/integrase n=1 Tax=Paenibacillus sp. LHD-38 TaxID=3072143 RepID=UPI00281093AD|nr:tyrosine-type recombinase/integrase [Paenibacillus sp. LHD-38]MDQ8738152.1 tyrosine-type recombinase/integrase [Paenibacillus sp. LHD-38]
MSNRYMHFFCPPGTNSRYQLIVVDPKKKPFMPLTDFYADQIGSVSDKTALSYLTSLEQYFHWLTDNGRYQGRSVRWDEEPEIVRETVQNYLFDEMACKVRDKDGYQLVSLTNKSPNTVALKLSALKSFYKSMVWLKYYAYENPLFQADAILEAYTERLNGVRKDKPRLPEEAGTEEQLPKHRRLTDSYFKVVNEEWIPVVIGDWDLPYKIYQGGKTSGWSLRDEVITRMLFETGARASEIIELTFGDYRLRANRLESRAFNKGSHKRRMKFIRFSEETLKLLIRYVETERSVIMKDNCRLGQMPDNAPIFVAENTNSLNYFAFYARWQKIVQAAGVKLNPHKARHWYVTNMMRGIMETSKTDAEIMKKKEELIQYMRWRDKNTIEVYEHYFNQLEFSGIQTDLFESMKEKEKAFMNQKRIVKARKPKAQEIIETAPISENDHWLNELLEGMAP